jgi:hypothetical protein
VSGVVVPVVVDGVEKGVSADLGGPTGCLVNVVVLEGNSLFKLANLQMGGGKSTRQTSDGSGAYIRRSCEVKAPVVVAVACG